MTDGYLCAGTTLANMVNLESIVTTPATVLPNGGGAPMPLQGGVSRRLLSGRLQRNGNQNGAWGYPVFDNGLTDLNTLRLALYGDYTTSSKQLYVITVDDTGKYSPFLCYVDCPYLGQSMTTSLFLNPINVRFDLIGGVLQSSTKTSNFTVTTSTHYLIADTSGGSVTFTLPALSGVTSDVPFTFYKSSASNNMVLDGNGSETVGNSLTKTYTSVGWVTIYKSSSTNWAILS